MAIDPREQNRDAFYPLPFGRRLSANTQGNADLATRIARLEAANAKSATLPKGGQIQNLLRNSDFSYSQLNYDGTGTADDVYGWVRGITPANRITPTSSGLRWDKIEGGLRVLNGALADDVSYQFSKRVILPGQTYFLIFLARLESAFNAQGAQLEYGFWDSSPGINSWITASLVGSPTSTAPTVTVVGAAGTTTYNYKVAAILSDGSVIVSADAVTATGNATLNSTNYNAIAWAGVPGAVRYDVFRTVGPTTGLIAAISSGATSFNDQGVTLQVGASVPVSTAAQARNTWAEIGANLSTEWASYRFQVDAPSAYALAQTVAGQQWLRVGFRNLPPGIPPILIDRFGLSFATGEWAPSPDDAAAVGDISTSPTSDGGRGNPRIFYVGGKWID